MQDVDQLKIAVSAEIPQPAVIIGLGEFGRQIRSELQSKVDLYAQFGSPLGSEYQRIVAPLLIPEDEGLWAVSDPEEIRQRFFQPQSLTTAARTIMSACDRVRVHSSYPLVDTVRPTIYVVGTTWSPVGRALLWPVAHLVRALLGRRRDYNLIGIFVTAQWSSDPVAVEAGDALSCELLEEGEHLIKDGSYWGSIIRGELAIQGGDDQGYDAIFLVDGLKNNNTTIVSHFDQPIEVETLVIGLIEGLLYGNVIPMIDQVMLDDYLRPKQQVYLGVGISSLVVPLRSIADTVSRYTVGKLIQDRLLVQPDQREPDARMMSELLAQIDERLAARILAVGQRALEENAEYELTSGHQGRFLTSVVQVGGQVQLFQLQLQGENLASESDNLDAAEVQKRINEEEASGRRLIKNLTEALARVRQPGIDELETICGSAISRQLRGGGSGLMRALGSMKQLVALLEQAAGAAEQTRTATIRRRHEAEAARRPKRRMSIDPRLLLHSALTLRARVPSLCARGLFLGVFLFQFFHDAIIRGVLFWPLSLLVPDGTVPSLALEGVVAAWLSVVIGLPVLLFIFLPLLVVQWHIYRRRRQLEVVTKEGLQEHFDAYRAQVLQQLRAHLQYRRLPELQAARSELQQYADANVQGVGYDIMEPTYQEYSVVDPRTVVEPFQQQVAEQIILHLGQRIVPSWSPANTGQHELWVLRPIPEITAVLEAQVHSAVKHVVAQPIEHYLRGQDIDDWFFRLWKSSVPWIKIEQPVGSLESGRDLVDLNILLVRGGTASSVVGRLGGNLSGYQILNWPDPYRISLLRIICGVTCDLFERYEQLQFSKALAQRQENLTKALRIGATPVESHREALTQRQEHLTQVAPASLSSLAAADLAPGVPAAIPQGGSPPSESFAAMVDALRSKIDAIKEELDRVGFEKGWNSLKSLADASAGQEPERKEITESLKLIDVSYETPALQDATRTAIADLYALLDPWLKQRGIEPIIPEVGELYDPNRHGNAIAEDHLPTLSDGVISKRMRRGYLIDGKMVVEPWVYVNKRS